MTTDNDSTQLAISKAADEARKVAEKLAAVNSAVTPTTDIVSAVSSLERGLREQVVSLSQIGDIAKDISRGISAPLEDTLKRIQSLTTPLAGVGDEISKQLSVFSANTALVQSVMQTTRDLQNINAALMGKNSGFQALLKELGKKREFVGLDAIRLANISRQTIEANYSANRESLEAAALEAKLAGETLDMTLPVDGVPAGTVHPISQVMDELAEIFADMGFAVATGPEIEDDWHNFTALNIPETHPARAMHDTFYLAGEHERPMVLRTHTSPVQIRTMTSQKPPIRIIAPGRVYRSDSDATHTPMFHQIEGLVIDKGITLGHLKWTLETFLKAYFERDDIVLRLRPSYFPFTEPSAEVDVGFTWTNGKRVIGGSGDAEGGGWMEVLGSGMVHRKVIEACGLDPEEWQGFAFGTGVDRLAMLKYGMDDLRAFFDGDLRWLKHYGFSALDVPTLSGGVGA